MQEQFSIVGDQTAPGHFPLKGEIIFSQNDSTLPLLKSSYQGQLDDVRQLVEGEDVDLDALSTQGFTSLALAASGGHLGVVQYLLLSGADKDLASLKARSPLCAAAEKGHLEVSIQAGFTESFTLSEHFLLHAFYLNPGISSNTYS